MGVGNSLAHARTYGRKKSLRSDGSSEHPGPNNIQAYSKFKVVESIRPVRPKVVAYRKPDFKGPICRSAPI